MAEVTVTLRFTHPDGRERGEEGFLPLTRDIADDIESAGDDLLADLDEDGGIEGTWELASYTILATDDDLINDRNPNEFASILKWAEWAEWVEEHGEAYALRYDDIGEHDHAQYEGCWDSEEEFAQDLVGSEVPDNVYFYIDWELYARDLLMDYSSYLGDKGYHIFSN